MKYICCWSGGKDSTASIILAHEMGEPLDTILFSEVMFDKKNGISGENPEHIYFIKKIAKPLFESWGYEVKILHADTDYLDFFFHTIKNPRTHLHHKGMHFGFPASGACGVKRDCKEKPIRAYLRSIKEPFTEYIGIGIDEPLRLRSMHRASTKVSLLEKYDYTTSMAKQKCIDYGLLSPAYHYSNRGGCWMCPNAKFNEHLYISQHFHEAWNTFVSLETRTNVANCRWNIYRHVTLDDINSNINLLDQRQEDYK